MSKWYGSINNRIEENRMFEETIAPGMGVTEYFWSDRKPYEVVRVIDQKHVYVKRMDHKLIGEAYSNKWELTLNEEAPEEYLTKRGKYWYWTIRDNEGHYKYHRTNVSFGKAEYYYDYEF